MTDAGTGIADNSYPNKPTTTTGGGIDATANIEVSGGSVTSFTLATPGTGYETGDTLSVSLPGADVVTPGTGEILALDPSFTGGTGFDVTDGSIDDIETTTNGSGNGATVRVMFSSSDAVTFILRDGGTGYEVGDEVYVTPTAAGGTTGTDMVLTVTSVTEGSTAPGPNVTITAEVDTII